MMSSAGAIGTAVLLFFLPGASAFLPSTSLPLSASARAARAVGGASTSSAQARRPSSLRMEIDWDFVEGGLAALAGTAVGWGMGAFVDYAAERSEARGAMSEATRLKMSAKLMDEDLVMPTDDDMLSNLRRAVRANMSEEERKEMDEKNRKEATTVEEEDDGW